MGGSGSGRKDKTTEMLNNMTVKNITPIGNINNEVLDLPNHSGVTTHPEMLGTDGFVKKTGDTMTGTLNGTLINMTGDGSNGAQNIKSNASPGATGNVNISTGDSENLAGGDIVLRAGEGGTTNGKIDLQKGNVEVTDNLTVETDLRVDGGNIGLTVDTDLIQLTSGVVTVNGEIHTTGDVGIGTATPGLPLEVNGSVGSFVAGGGNYFHLRNPSNGNDWVLKHNDLKFHIQTETGSGEIMTFQTDGKVGIGTTSPGTVLDLVDTDGDSTLRFRTSNVDGRLRANDTAGSVALYPTTNHKLTLGSNNNAERVTIATDGKVGIGDANPAAKLEVNQNSATAAEPVLKLTQVDVSEEMIEFDSTIGTGNAIEAVGVKTLTTTHFIKVTLPGGLTRYIPVGTIA